jgi:hypothetical protein
MHRLAVHEDVLREDEVKVDKTCVRRRVGWSSSSGSRAWRDCTVYSAQLSARAAQTETASDRATAAAAAAAAASSSAAVRHAGAPANVQSGTCSGGGALDPPMAEWCRRVARAAVAELGKETVQALAWARHTRKPCTDGGCECHGTIINFVKHATACTAADCPESVTLPGQGAPTLCGMMRNVMAHEARCKVEQLNIARVQCAMCLAATAMAQHGMKLRAPGPASEPQMFNFVVRLVATSHAMTQKHGS